MRAKILFNILFYCVYLSSCNSFTEEDPEKKNAELQKIEIEIIQKITNNDKDGALELLKSLIHPSDEKWNNKVKGGTTFGLPNDFYTYSEWWSERREALQNKILAMKSKKILDDTNKGSSTTSNKDLKEHTEVVSEPNVLNLPENYLGLYIMQFENGSTKFYKFFKDGNGIPGAVYQDNVSGNVRVENYVINSFDENTKVALLESKKKPGSFVNVRFAYDQESDNGFKLTDSDGVSYSLAGN